MHFVDKEILDALVSLQGAVLHHDTDGFSAKTYIGVSLCDPLVYKDLPSVCGVSAAKTLKDFLLTDLDERLCKHMGIPWNHEISMYGELKDKDA
jgi:hypothetical protein